MSNWERDNAAGREGSGGTRTEQDGGQTMSAPALPTTERPQPSAVEPSTAQPSTAQPSTDGAGRESASRAELRRSRTPVAAVLLALLVGIILGAGGATLLRPSSDGFAGAIDETRYQAVILSNDKVYFGKISAASGDFYELKNAFFLRETRAGDGAEPVRALLPVNREIHAPDNDMLIRKEEVVLVENLAKDSPILQEIQRQKR